MPAVKGVSIAHWNGADPSPREDTVAVEEPLEIRINGESVVVTMRTPGEDFALAAGFLFAEGIVESADSIESMTRCETPGAAENPNILNVSLDPGWKQGKAAERWQRHFTATSSCGLCGKASIEAVRCTAGPIAPDGFTVPASIIQSLPDRLRSAQRAFQQTGGLHAAGLFDGHGALLGIHEDVGRHNAVDKLIGAEVLDAHIPLSSRILLVSGRTSFEILQKAAAAGVPVVCAVSAPSSLAVELASDIGITLVGFLRGHSMNVYTGLQRITALPTP